LVITQNPLLPQEAGRRGNKTHQIVGKQLHSGGSDTNTQKNKTSGAPTGLSVRLPKTRYFPNTCAHIAHIRVTAPEAGYLDFRPIR
jgi:hypothetical protein|tara:strand:- start:263 stop:520 length:258 start_codon:yes stop_codon:yes gene_type:complete